MRKILLIFTLAFTAATILTCCGNDNNDNEDNRLADNDSTIILHADSTAKPSPVVHSLPTHIVPGRLRDIFNDSNYTQLTAATANGIVPITDLRSAYNLRVPIVKIHTCDAYMLDSLSNSMPYLVPKAAQLLKDIGHGFSDTIKARGGKAYRIKVTSMMRSDYSVYQLRRHNRNASENSCHRYGTTFDVSWIKFDCQDSSYVVSLEDLKNILGEIMYEKRSKGLCYVKFETKQGCFHVTVR
jgi:hypothetical protein